MIPLLAKLQKVARTFIDFYSVNYKGSSWNSKNLVYFLKNKINWEYFWLGGVTILCPFLEFVEMCKVISLQPSPL